ncbi:hypothetical protein [Methylobacterium oxalidis]|uniref:hypothetical protein n=1 Tax=Methylobacterium oxalidis TaxID=944322 RepID=UPI0011BF28C6|nr:hypothetical protein [Methylobacterium oxalidis]
MGEAFTLGNGRWTDIGSELGALGPPKTGKSCRSPRIGVPRTLQGSAHLMSAGPRVLRPNAWMPFAPDSMRSTDVAGIARSPL